MLPFIFPYILFIRFIRYASVRCAFYAVLFRWMYVRHPFCPVRFRFSYFAYPVCVRKASVTRPLYSVSTSTDSQRITILSTDNFYFHSLDVRSCFGHTLPDSTNGRLTDEKKDVRTERMSNVYTDGMLLSRKNTLGSTLPKRISLLQISSIISLSFIKMSMNQSLNGVETFILTALFE